MARGRRDYEKAVIVVESEGYPDLHGRILMNDTFEDTPFKWVGTGTGTHYETRQQRAAYNGSFGAELDILSDAPPTSRFAIIQRYVPIDVTERLQMEIFWRANDTELVDRFEMYIRYHDGLEEHLTMIQWGYVQGAWRYYNDVAGMTLIPGAQQTFKDHAWNELTLSVDFVTNEYIRMKSNNLDINMGGIPCWHTGDLTGSHVMVAVMAANITADQLIISIDDAVLKELER